jgi:hypothetical protein
MKGAATGATATAAATPATPATPAAIVARLCRHLSCDPYRHAANSGRSGLPIRIRSMPRTLGASPMLSVDTRARVLRYSRSHSSIASHRSSSGDRFHRRQCGHTAQSLPLAASNASREPTGKCSTTSLLPSRPWQKRHVLNMKRPRQVVPNVECDQASDPGLLRARGLNRFVIRRADQGL